MLKLTDPKKVTLPNAWGRDTTTNRHVMLVERKDVNSTLPDYGGHGQPGYQFKQEDVGRLIEVLTDTGYHCWGFGTGLDIFKGHDRLTSLGRPVYLFVARNTNQDRDITAPCTDEGLAGFVSSFAGVGVIEDGVQVAMTLKDKISSLQPGDQFGYERHWHSLKAGPQINKLNVRRLV